VKNNSYSYYHLDEARTASKCDKSMILTIRNDD